MAETKKSAALLLLVALVSEGLAQQTSDLVIKQNAADANEPLLLAMNFAERDEKVQTEAMVGEIRIVAFNYAPRGWAFCDGQLLLISQYSALFSLLGTTYGGDGRVTFALPDLRGRSPVHVGEGKDLAAVKQGQLINGEKVKSAKDGTATLPGLGMRYIIALTGHYPSRNGDGLKDRFIGEIGMFAGSFAPGGWANCDGQQLDVNDHKTVFEVIGKTYGGTETTFALPDLRGRVPVHAGRDPGLDPVEAGQKGDGNQFAIPGKRDRAVKTPSHLGIRYMIATHGIDPSSRTELHSFVGEVRMLAGNATPERWFRCDEQLLQISEQTTLFSLVGPTYGGDGRSTFAVPGLRGRAVLHAGLGPGLQDLKQSERTGSRAATADSGETIRTQPTLGINYIISPSGIFPSRP